MVFELYSEYLFTLCFGAVWRHYVKFRVSLRGKSEEKNNMWSVSHVEGAY